MCDCEIPIGLDRLPQPRHASLIVAEMDLGGASDHGPDIGVGVARREAESLTDMGLGFFAATEKGFCETDGGVGVCQISATIYLTTDSPCVIPTIDRPTLRLLAFRRWTFLPRFLRGPMFLLVPMLRLLRL